MNQKQLHHHEARASKNSTKLQPCIFLHSFQAVQQSEKFLGQILPLQLREPVSFHYSLFLQGMGLGEHYRFLFFHCLSPESRGTPSPSSRECFNLEESVMEQKVTHVISRKPVIHVQVSWPPHAGLQARIPGCPVWWKMGSESQNWKGQQGQMHCGASNILWYHP